MTSKEEQARKLASEITNFVNNFDYLGTSNAFNEALSREHRTLQQSFTRLALRWLVYVASPNYRTDARNADSKIIAQDLMREFGKFIKDKYGSGANPDPSVWLGTI